MLYTYLKPENEDAIYEQSILNEMNITKNDLKNPEVLKKVLEQSKKEKNRYEAFVSVIWVIGVLSDVVLGIVAGSILVSIMTFMPIVIGVSILALALLNKCPNYEEKNINKLVSKTEKLKNSAEKLKDEKAKSDIISNCDKILKSVDKYRKSESHKKAVEKLESDKKLITTLIKTTKGEDIIVINHIDDVYADYVIADKLGICKPSDLDKGIIKYCNSHMRESDDNGNGILELFTGKKTIEDAKLDVSEIELEKLSKEIPGFSSNAKMFVFYAIDDTIVFYNPKNSKFYWGDYTPGFDSNQSLYAMVKRDGRLDIAGIDEDDIQRLKDVYDSMVSK